MGLVQLYTVAEPVYGSSPYTATQKKVDHEPLIEKLITGSGTESKNEVPEAEDKMQSDPILDQLNEGKKEKMSPSVYSSFLHPRLETGTMTFDRKRKTIVPSGTEDQPAKRPMNGPSMKKPKFESERAKHKFQFI